ncbi:MAG: zf-HC2 domain-containing protein [Acidobacteriota bacterium]
MDHVMLDEQNVVERYVLGQLTPEETERFEQHYLDCPRCLERLELTEILHDGLRGVATEEATQGAARVGVAALLWAWWRQRGRAIQAGLITSILMVIILPWALLVPRLDGRASEILAPHAGSLILPLSPERSTGDEPPSSVLTVGAEPEWVVLDLQSPPMQTSPPTVDWRIDLTDGERIVWSGPVRPDDSGRVALTIHTSWLDASIYTVELVRVDPDGSAQRITRFAFAVRRTEPSASLRFGGPSPGDLAMGKTYFVSTFLPLSKLSKETVLRRGSALRIEPDGVHVDPGGVWNTVPPGDSFDIVGMALVRRERPVLWYGIKFTDGGLLGIFSKDDPRDVALDFTRWPDLELPSAIAAWEADEENHLVDPATIDPPHATAAGKTYTVTEFEPDTPKARTTVLKKKSKLQIGSNGVRVTPGGLWDTYTACKPFDVVGIAKEQSGRPTVWYSIQIQDQGSSLTGTFYGNDPCGNAAPSAIGSWEADEENTDIEPVAPIDVTRYIISKVTTDVPRTFDKTLHVGSELTIADGIITCGDSVWENQPGCSSFDVAGTVDVGNTPFWFGIQINDGMLAGAFYVDDPCDRRGIGVPTAIATWEAEEENTVP